MRSPIAFVLASACFLSNSDAAWTQDQRPNASQAWRELERDYRSGVNDLREKRRELGEKAKTVQDQLDEADWVAVSEQAKVDFQQASDDFADSLGDAAIEYSQGVGKRQRTYDEHVIEAGVTIITETLPALADMQKALYAEVDFQFEMDRLNDDLNGYEREIRKFDKDIAELERNADLSEQIADFYENDVKAVAVETKEIRFKLVQSGQTAIKAAQQKKEQKEAERRREEEERRREQETVPPGWLPCTCPEVHTNFGRVIRGTRYHQEGPRCP